MIVNERSCDGLFAPGHALHAAPGPVAPAVARVEGLRLEAERLRHTVWRGPYSTLRIGVEDGLVDVAAPVVVEFQIIIAGNCRRGSDVGRVGRALADGTALRYGAS